MNKRKLSLKWNIAYWVAYVVLLILYVSCVCTLSSLYGNKAFWLGTFAAIVLAIQCSMAACRSHYECSDDDREVKS